MLIWLFAGFAFGSSSFAGAADPLAGHGHAAMLSMHEAMSGGQPRTPDMPVGHDHAAMQCCITFCAASCVGVLQNDAFVKMRTVSAYIFSTDGMLMRPLYLDADPPVSKV